MISLGDSAAVLTLWEQTADLAPARRALCLLAALTNLAASSGASSVGERDRQLLLARRELFGDRIEAITGCAQCGNRVVVSFSISQVTREPGSTVSRTLHSDGYEVRWRLPTSQELADIAEGVDPSLIRARLLELCLLQVRRGPAALTAADCPESVIQQVCEAMSHADPFADMQLDTACPECGSAWRVAFDIGNFLWRELDFRARQLLREVHQLASAYGWSEPEILALTARRRRVYLEMVET